MVDSVLNATCLLKYFQHWALMDCTVWQKALIRFAILVVFAQMPTFCLSIWRLRGLYLPDSLDSLGHPNM